MRIHYWNVTSIPPDKWSVYGRNLGLSRCYDVTPVLQPTMSAMRGPNSHVEASLIFHHPASTKTGSCSWTTFRCSISCRNLTFFSDFKKHFDVWTRFAYRVLVTVPSPGLHIVIESLLFQFHPSWPPNNTFDVWTTSTRGYVQRISSVLSRWGVGRFYSISLPANEYSSGMDHAIYRHGYI